jgi:putative NADPH-quinone reductase
VHPVGWRTSLRVFILYANPVGPSFGAALLKQSVDALGSRGHEIDDCDLYAERFIAESPGERRESDAIALARCESLRSITR